MTYPDVSERFAARFAARSGRGGLFHLDWAESPDPDFPEHPCGVVWTDRIDDPDSSVAPSLASLLVVAPRAADFPSVVFGGGEPVAWLWERIGEQVLEVRENCPDHQMAGAVALALGWVW